MSFLPFAVAAWLFIAGLYGVVSSRNLISTILSLTVVQSATYVVLLGVGYRSGGKASIFADIPQVSSAVDPVVQVLVLTDIVIEATGSGAFGWQAAEAVAVNGVVCLLSVTGGKEHIDIASDELNDNMVLSNKLMFGSVNSHRSDFEQGVKDFAELTRRWPGALERFITRRLRLKDIRSALERPKGDLKTVVELVE